MPSSFPRPCASPGCHSLVTGARYCAEHIQSITPRTIYDQTRRKSDTALAMAARIRSSARWKRVRAIKVARHPLCEDPFGTHAKRDETRTVDQVHHIKSIATHPELAFAMGNLMSVCTGCHARLEADAS